MAPLKGDMDRYANVDMEKASDMAVSRNLGCFKKPLDSIQRVWGWYKAGVELLLLRAIWQFLSIVGPVCGCPYSKSRTICGLC